MQEEVIAEAPAEEVIPESAGNLPKPRRESEQETKPELRRRLYAGGTRFHRAEAFCWGIATDCQACRGGSRKPDETADGTGATETRGAVRKPPPSQFQDYESYIEAVAEWKADQKFATIRAESKRNSANVKHRNAQARYSKNSAAAQRRNMRISRKLPLILPFRLILSTWQRPLQIRTWVVMWRAATRHPSRRSAPYRQAFPPSNKYGNSRS